MVGADAVAASAPTIDARAVRLSYAGAPVLDVESFSVASGEVVCIVGRSGSGKTSFLQCLSGLIRADGGEITLAGERLDSLSEQARAQLRGRHAGFVFQSADLVPELTLAENIELPLRLARVGRTERRARVQSLVDDLGIAEAAGRRFHEVSGGQAQRAAIGRAVANAPAVVFADEPTGALDSTNRAAALDLLIGLARSQGSCLVIVTHDETVAAAADRVVTMADGRLV